MLARYLQQPQNHRLHEPFGPRVCGLLKGLRCLDTDWKVLFAVAFVLLVTAQ